MEETAIPRSGESFVELVRNPAYPVGARKWLLMGSLTAVFFLLLALYAGVLGVLLPNQIQLLDPANKEGNLAIMFAVTSVFSTLTTPIAGALSDRTQGRFGRRTPWIVIGALIGGASLFAVPQMHSFWAITGFWVVSAIALNSMQAAITTIVADRFPEQERGTVSGFVGAGMTAGLTAGTVVAGLMASHLVAAYGLFAAAIAAVCVIFVALNPEPRLAVAAAEPFRLDAFLKSFWVSPRKYPDFGWAFLGRFTIYMGYQGIVTYLLYILQDHIHLSIDEANKTIAALSSVTFVALVISGFASGFLSDRIGRRKPLVFASSIIMGIALLVPLLMPTVEGMYGYAVLIGLGYGAFMSVDMALMTQVLPKRADGDESTGKDLGLLTTAINIPQIIAPVLAVMLLKATGNDYNALFIAAIAFVFAGSFFVWPIKSVR
jgi:MFS family permease